MTDLHTQARKIVEALTIIDAQALSVMQDDTGSRPAYLNCGWVHEKCQEALRDAPAFLAQLERLTAEPTDAEIEDVAEKVAGALAEKGIAIIDDKPIAKAALTAFLKMRRP